MKKQSVILKSATETKKFAELLAKKILKEKPAQKGAFVIGLQGNLGSGKTTFAQGFAKGLGLKEKITSPTFVILKKFEIPAKDVLTKDGPLCYKGPSFVNFYHVDCYRLQKPQELLDLGWEEIISNPKNIVVVEWADRIKKILPKTTVWISLSHRGKSKRILRQK